LYQCAEILRICGHAVGTIHLTLMDITHILCSPQLTGCLGDQGMTDMYTACTMCEDIISRVLTTQLDRDGQPHLAG